jgi:hypothetical protein
MGARDDSLSQFAREFLRRLAATKKYRFAPTIDCASRSFHARDFA